jgi:hypothetical protein
MWKSDTKICRKFGNPMGNRQRIGENIDLKKPNQLKTLAFNLILI